jgi:hypothetical protein
LSGLVFYGRRHYNTLMLGFASELIFQSLVNLSDGIEQTPNPQVPNSRPESRNRVDQLTQDASGDRRLSRHSSDNARCDCFDLCCIVSQR